MKLQEYIDYIKLMITGGVLELELPDTSLAQVVNSSLEEIQKYIDIPQFVTVPYETCIDLSKIGKHDNVVKVFRAVGYMDGTNSLTSNMNDPMYMQQWMVFSNGGTMYNFGNYVLNYLSYVTLLQMRNTVSTDMTFIEDKKENKLYINCTYDMPQKVTIEYIPVYETVEDINDDYWIDIIKRMSLAKTKIVLGRIRSHVKQSNALWQLDGDQLLQEGTEEYNTLKQRLDDNLPIYYPVD